MAEGGRGAIALYNGFVAAEVLRRRLPPSTRILDFGDPGGLLGPHLAAVGMAVERPEGEAAAANGSYGAAFAEVTDWGPVRSRANHLADLLRPGAPVLVRVRLRPGQSAAEVARDLGPVFTWQRTAALGLLVPGEEHGAWAERHPHAFAALCAGEGMMRGLPVFRRQGKESLLLGRKRPEAAR